MIKNNTNPYFVAELETGYVVLGDHQHFRGYTLLLCKQHVTELIFLDKDFRIKYMEEMCLVAQAVYNVFKPEKLNYELLGNADTHLHWHIFPRVSGDTPKPGPVWRLPTEEMYSEANKPGSDELAQMTSSLRGEIERLLSAGA